MSLSTADAVDAECPGAQQGGPEEPCVAEGDTWKLCAGMSHGCGD